MKVIIEPVANPVTGRVVAYAAHREGLDYIQGNGYTEAEAVEALFELLQDAEVTAA